MSGWEYPSVRLIVDEVDDLTVAVAINISIVVIPPWQLA